MLALLTILCFLAPTAADADLWGHLTFGRDIVRTGWVHTSDPYSFTSDRPWVNHEWLAEVIMWSAYSGGGAAGLVALKLLLACAAGMALLGTWRARALPDAWRDALLFLTALGTWPLLATMRPQAFSVCLFALLLFVLHRIQTGSTWGLAALPLIFGVWTNVHGGWVVGAATLAIFVGCSWRNSSWTTHRRLLLLAAAAASALATLCNPYGVSMLAFLAETVRPARAEIIEWRPATGVPIAGLALWALPTAIAVAGLWRRRQRVELPWLLLVLLVAVGSFRVVRLVGFYALAVGFFIAPAIAPARATASRADAPAPWFRVPVTCAALIAAAVVLFGRTILIDGQWCPERDATLFVRSQGLQGRMLTWFDYGEFAIWHFSPAIRVSMDGRRETVYSDDIRERHFRIYTNAPDALDEVARIDPDYVWLPVEFAVVDRLERAGWKPVFKGSRSVILTKRPDHTAEAIVLQPVSARRLFPGP